MARRRLVTIVVALAVVWALVTATSLVLYFSGETREIKIERAPKP